MPDLTNPQTFNRYTYVFDDPIGLNDPSGHGGHCRDDWSGYKCKRQLANQEGPSHVSANPWAGVLSSSTFGCSAITLACLTGSAIGGYGLAVVGGDNKNGLDFTGYSAWETQVLQEVYDSGNTYAMHGVNYILQNNIHIAVGNNSQLLSWDPWISGWYDWDVNGDQYVYLSPNLVKEGSMPDAWGLSIIIHEAKHIEQGMVLANSHEGEMEAWKIGFSVDYALTRDKPANFDDVWGARTVYDFDKAVKKDYPTYWTFLSLLPTTHNSNPLQTAAVLAFHWMVHMSW